MENMLARSRLLATLALVATLNPAHALECNIPWQLSFIPSARQRPTEMVLKLVEVKDDTPIVISLNHQNTSCSSNPCFPTLSVKVLSNVSATPSSFDFSEHFPSTYIVHGHKISIQAAPIYEGLTGTTIGGCIGMD